MASTKKNPCQDEYKKIAEKQKALLDATPDEEIGKMYRQHKEASDFFSERGLFL